MCGVGLFTSRRIRNQRVASHHFTHVRCYEELGWQKDINKTSGSKGDNIKTSVGEILAFYKLK
jgi:hypothetical protein